MSAPAHLGDEYLAYLRSPLWAGKRRAALEAAGHRCQVCNSPSRLDVHHRTYERFGGAELPGDLTVLCRACHDLFHGARRVAATPPPSVQALTMEPTNHRWPSPKKKPVLDSGAMLALLRARGPLTPGQLAEALHWTVAEVQSVGKLLKREGQVYREHGHICVHGQHVKPTVPASKKQRAREQRARERSEDRHLMPHLKGATRR